MTGTSPQFDCFLSHNSADKPAVEALARRLEDEAGVRVWLDKWNLIPGEPWQEELERALDASATCAVFLGPNAISPWENEEMRSALGTRVHRPGFRVVPVLLPGADLPERGTLPRFLARLTWVDFRGPKALDDAEAFHRLVCGIKGMEPGRGARPAGDIAPFSPDECPYRGLEVFDEAHARYFFGREAMTQHLVEALRGRLAGVRFLAIVGASGSGKSSLARAGLLAKLRHGALPGSIDWRYAVFKPTAHPLQELAAHMAKQAGSGQPLALLEAFESDERALHLHIRAALAGQPAECRQFLLVDQFEELFTLGSGGTERRQFIDNLRYAATVSGGQTLTVITLRADFLPKAVEYPELADLLSAHQFLVSPMEEADLRQAIEAPAELSGLAFEPGLVDTLLQDAGHEPGSLPLLEHALLRLCQRAGSDRTMRLAAYRDIQGVAGALADHADRSFQALSEAQRPIARRILLRLTQPGEGTEDTRRRTTIEELVTRPEEDAEVVGALAAARLLTVTRDEEANKVWIDVAHEALIRGWPRLRAWIAEDREGLQLHRRVSVAAVEWNEKGRDESFLFAGARLAQALEWRDRDRPELNPLEREFLEAGEVREASEREETERRRRRELAKARRINLFSVSALVLFAVLAGFLYRWGQEAEEQKRLSRQYLYVANLNLAEKAYEGKHYARVEELLRASLPANEEEAAQDPRGFAWYRLWGLLHDERLSLFGHEDMVDAVAISPDGTLLASGGRDKTVRLWDLSSGRELHVMRGHLQSVSSVAFSPDGKTLASGSDDETIKLWDVATGTRRKTLKAESGTVTSVKSVAFSPDGALLASGGGGSSALILWDVTAWKPIRILDAEELGAVESLAFSPDGKTLATGDSRYNAMLWDVATGQRLKILSTRSNPYRCVAFSPDGTLLAGGNQDALDLWNLATGEMRNLWKGTDLDYVNALAFSPDGKSLAGAVDDNAVRLWDVATGQELNAYNTRSHEGYAAYAVAFTPDGKTIAGGHWEGTIKLWDAAPKRAETLTGNGWAFTPSPYVAFSPDGQTLANGSSNTVKIWDLASGRELHVLDQPGAVYSVGFSPDGKVLASGGDHTVKLWEAATGEELTSDGLYNLDYVEGINLPVFAPDGMTLALVDWENTVIKLFDTGTGKALGTLKGHEAKINALAFAPDGRTLASASRDNTVRLWDVADAREIKTIGEHTQAVLALAFMPDGTTLATGGKDHTVRLWDVATGRTTKTLRGHGGTVYAVAFSPDGRTLASGGEDKTVKLWDVATGQELATLTGESGDDTEVTTVTFSPDGRILASGIEDGNIRLHYAPTAEQVRAQLGESRGDR